MKYFAGLLAISSLLSDASAFNHLHQTVLAKANRLSSSIGRQNGENKINGRSIGRIITALRMGIDVSSLPFEYSPSSTVDISSSSSMSQEINNFMQQQMHSSVSGGDLNDIQNALILLGGAAFLVYEKRPKGSITKTDSLEIKKSSISGAELGVYAREIIPKETVIGTFPGYLLGTEEALKRKKDEESRKKARRYMWAVSDELVLDPTNDYGALEMELSYLGGLYKVDTKLARINEPTVGRDCNVFTRITSDGGSVVEVVAERTLFPGEELFMDYGNLYDRSDYDNLEREQRQNAARAQTMKLQEEEEMLTLQPITTGTDDKAKADTQTTLSDGFIAKLSKSKTAERQLDKVGIISPEDGAKMFTELGANMFADAEDRGLIDGILGKDESSSSSSSRKASRILSPEDAVGMFGRSGGSSEGDGTDDEIMKDLARQMGKSSGSQSSSSAGDFSDLFMSKAMKPFAAETAGSVPVSSPPADAVDKDGGKAGGEVKSAEATSGEARLTKEEAEDLQRRIDALSDEQLEAVFSRMRSALSTKLQEELTTKLKEGPISVSDASQSSAVKIPVSPANVTPSTGPMPRTAPIDEEVRKKYGKELSAIEDELEKIYSNPLGVWQELLTDPDKYLSKEQRKELEDEELQ